MARLKIGLMQVGTKVRFRIFEQAELPRVKSDGDVRIWDRPDIKPDCVWLRGFAKDYDNKYIDAEIIQPDYVTWACDRISEELFFNNPPELVGTNIFLWSI